jgi:NAD(P)-dependent dehydrogenase (short-subunit alcohol dehydrogenase family)
MSNLFRVDGKVAVVIGGTGGIGEAIGYGLAEYGAKVIIAGRNKEKAAQVVQNIENDFKSSAVAFPVDVKDENSVSRLAEQVISEFGTIDILVNSQGVNIKKPATEFPLSDWDEMFDVNVTGMMLTCRAFGKIMVEKKQGKVINLSSVRGARATLWGGNEAYCATKGAVDMITRALASEWAPYNINVNAIAPTWIATKLSEQTTQDPARLQKGLANVPLKRIGQPRDLVGLSVFLASPASDFITGQIIYLDGGATAVV